MDSDSEKIVIDPRTFELPVFGEDFWGLVHSTWPEYAGTRNTPLGGVDHFISHGWLTKRRINWFELTEKGYAYFYFVKIAPYYEMNIAFGYIRPFIKILIQCASREITFDTPWVREFCEFGVIETSPKNGAVLTSRGSDLISKYLTSYNGIDLIKDFYYESEVSKKTLIRAVPLEEWAYLLSVLNQKSILPSARHYVEWITQELKKESS